MTRFGKISPIWHNFKKFGQIFEGLIYIWENVNLPLGKCDAFGYVFIVVDSHMLLNNLAIWSH